jgi:hypothetical protein
MDTQVKWHVGFSDCICTRSSNPTSRDVFTICQSTNGEHVAYALSKEVAEQMVKDHNKNIP